LPLISLPPRRVIWDEDPGFLRFVVLREEVADKAWLAAATAASSEELPEECQVFQNGERYRKMESSESLRTLTGRHMKKLQQSSEITTCNM